MAGSLLPIVWLPGHELQGLPADLPRHPGRRVLTLRGATTSYAGGAVAFDNLPRRAWPADWRGRDTHSDLRKNTPACCAGVALDPLSGLHASFVACT